MLYEDLLSDILINNLTTAQILNPQDSGDFMNEVQKGVDTFNPFILGV